MATRADFDGVVASLQAAINAALTRCSQGGFSLTDQDIANLKAAVDNINRLCGGSGGGGGGASLSIDHTPVAASTTAELVLSVPTAPVTSQDWVIDFNPNILSAPPVVTLGAQETAVKFTVTAGAPNVDTPTKVGATFGGQTAFVDFVVARA